MRVDLPSVHATEVKIRWYVESETDLLELFGEHLVSEDARVPGSPRFLAVTGGYKRRGLIHLVNMYVLGIEDNLYRVEHIHTTHHPLEHERKVPKRLIEGTKGMEAFLKAPAVSYLPSRSRGSVTFSYPTKAFETIVPIPYWEVSHDALPFSYIQATKFTKEDSDGSREFSITLDRAKRVENLRVVVFFDREDETISLRASQSALSYAVSVSEQFVFRKKETNDDAD